MGSVANQGGTLEPRRPGFLLRVSHLRLQHPVTDLSYSDSSPLEQKQAFTIDPIVSIDCLITLVPQGPVQCLRHTKCALLSRIFQGLRTRHPRPSPKDRSFLGMCRVWATQVYWINPFQHTHFFFYDVNFPNESTTFSLSYNALSL